MAAFKGLQTYRSAHARTRDGEMHDHFRSLLEIPSLSLSLRVVTPSGNLMRDIKLAARRSIETRKEGRREGG